VRGNNSGTMWLGTVVVATLLCYAAPSKAANAADGSAILQPAVWQGPEINAPASSATAVDANQSTVNPLRIALQDNLQNTPPIPPQQVQAPVPTAVQGARAPTHPPAPARSPAERAAGTATMPLLDGNTPTEELMPPVVDGCTGRAAKGHFMFSRTAAAIRPIGRGVAAGRPTAKGPACATTGRSVRDGISPWMGW
jgi:hypothetical protein